MAKKKGLGRGLDALMDDLDKEFPASEGLVEVSIDSISPNPYQPRSKIKDKELKPLVESIKSLGVLEPILVKEVGPNRYELIAGERRLRASQAAKLDMVPVIIREATPAQQLEIALVENLLRENLNAMEQAEAYKRLTDEFGHTQADIAKLAGQDRSTVANILRLLNLPSAVKTDLRQNRLTLGHGRALLALEKEELILNARDQVLRGQLSVRETEALVKRMLKGPRPVRKPLENSEYFEKIAEEIAARLGSKVRINRSGKKGRIEISYSSNEELEALMKFFNVRPS